MRQVDLRSELKKAHNGVSMKRLVAGHQSTTTNADRARGKVLLSTVASWKLRRTTFSSYGRVSLSCLRQAFRNLIKPQVLVGLK